MAIDGYYYLHVNDALIWKPFIDGAEASDFRESDFVKHFWPLALADREGAWSLLVEAMALKANPLRLIELAALWQCDDADAQRYAERIGLRLYRDGDRWCVTRKFSIDLHCCPYGFGVTALEAMADLCRKLGFRAQKIWGPTFKSLVQCGCLGRKLCGPCVQSVA